MEKSLTIFPEPAAFVKPSERALHNPALRKNRKSMKFIPFYNFYFRPADGFDRLREIFSGISSVG